MDKVENHTIPLKQGQLAITMIGEGKPLLFLHGGPGDTHDYLRKMIGPLLEQNYQCILFDQRGSGKSFLSLKNEETLHINQLHQDILRIKEVLHLPELTLVGHSWGAMLALTFIAEFPHDADRVLLLNLGPMTREMGEITKANLFHPLTEQEFSPRLFFRTQCPQRSGQAYFEIGVSKTIFLSNRPT